MKNVLIQHITSLNSAKIYKPKIKDEVKTNEQDVYRLARRN